MDHGMGNLRSVAKALEAAGAAVTVTSDARTLARRDALCVPGQGIFTRCIENLRAGGLDDLVREWIASERAFLGICLGMQILFEGSEENAPGEGLGVLSGRCTRLPDSVTVPHIGWNTVARGNGDGRSDYFYFDHSYAAHPRDDSIVTGWSEHGERFAARIDTGVITAVQFHPEKSSTAGIALLRDWVAGA